MNKQKAKRAKRILRHQRVRSIVKGTASQPRLSIFRSLKNICLQIINDEIAKTLVAVDGHKLPKILENPYKGKTAVSYATGLTLAKKALEKGISQVVFDRGGYAYHGRVKAAAEGARAGGLKF